MNPLMAAARDIRVEAIYDRERGHMKIILVGSMEQNAAYFKLITLILASEK
jgi:hypothetical protein